jgi:hypothetical protein
MRDPPPSLPGESSRGLRGAAGFRLGRCGPSWMGLMDLVLNGGAAACEGRSALGTDCDRRSAHILQLCQQCAFRELVSEINPRGRVLYAGWKSCVKACHILLQTH